MSVPRRRPEILNNRAATTASSSVNGWRSGNILAARSTSCSPTGPHKNSAQAIELIPDGTFDLSQVRNFMSSGELRTSEGRKGDKSNFLYRSFRGRPRECNVNSKPKRSAIHLCQSLFPNGRPL
jgi:hypothetical protein